MTCTTSPPPRTPGGTPGSEATPDRSSCPSALAQARHEQAAQPHVSQTLTRVRHRHIVAHRRLLPGRSWTLSVKQDHLGSRAAGRLREGTYVLSQPDAGSIGGAWSPTELSGFPGLGSQDLKVYGHSFSLAQIYRKQSESSQSPGISGKIS